MNIFLTGATGFIGGSIAKALLHAGHTVTGLARTDEAAQRLKEQSITPFSGDIRNPSGFAQGVREADAVILDIHMSGAKAQHILGWIPQAPFVLDDLIHGSYSSTSIDRV